MINLTPINKKIQKRLFEKMRVLGRKTSTNTNQPAKGGGSLTHAKMATRSTFLRMTSGQLNPVILMGGKLKDDGSMYGGYDDIYGSRTYKTGGKLDTGKDVRKYVGTAERGDYVTQRDGQVGEASTTNTLENKLKRPIPGVKGVDVTFKGGVRALREATITWTCWDFDELDLLMPHFLAHGKTVMIEWGWVYDKDTLQKLPDFLKTDDFGNKSLSADVYKNYRNEIFDADGDFDMMVGMIKNFEFTTRDDGGFDCQTILTSVGASIMENPQPNDTTLDPNITYNLSVNEDSRETAAKIKKATGETGTDSDKRGNTNSLINLNTTVSLKLFIKKIDRYIFESITGLGKEMRAHSETKTSIQKSALEKGFFKDKLKKDKNLFGKTYTSKRNKTTQEETSYIFGSSNKYIQSMYFNVGGGVQAISKTWVRWGWFEDNILSKFLSVTSTPNATAGDSSYDPIITEFRSIERLLDTDSNDSKEYESVRIKNSNQLQTTNINHYILPGQLYPQSPKSFIIKEDEKPATLTGDNDFMHKLKKVTMENFSPFTTGDETVPRVEMVTEHFLGEKNVTDFVGPQPANIEAQIKTRQVKKTTQEVVVGKHGYLRNMLINTDLIKQAFGVSSTDTFTVESINVIESIESLFSLLNQELNFWNFKITTDEVETSRAKIIDDQVTNFDFEKTTSDQKSIIFGEEVVTEDTQEEGVFFFPVWSSDSIVKRQNISAKIPDAMQLSVMYGSNMDSLKDFANPGSQFAEKEGVLAGGLFNKNQDSRTGGLDVAYRNTNTRKIGVIHGKDINDASAPLRPAADDDITQFLIDNSIELEKTFEARLKKINTSLKISTETQDAFTKEFDSSVPPPFASRLDDIQLQKLLAFEKDREFYGWNKGELTDLFGSVFHKTGEMKTQFKRSVSYLTTQYGINKQANTPLLIPLELELDIDGIGGIYPGNSYHSTYVPSRYQENTVFQCFDVNHRLDSSGWTVTITGKMRATMNNIFDGYKTLQQLEDAQFENYERKAETDEAKLDAEDEKRRLQNEQQWKLRSI